MSDSLSDPVRNGKSEVETEASRETTPSEVKEVKEVGLLERIEVPEEVKEVKGIDAIDAEAEEGDPPETIDHIDESDDEDELEADGEQLEIDPLILAMMECEPFVASNEPGVVYAMIDNRDARLAVPIASQEFEDYIVASILLAGEVVRFADVRRAVDMASALARRSGRQKQTCMRVGEHEGDIWVDLAGPAPSFLRITRDGYTLESESHVPFTRAQSMEALPVPEADGDLDELRELVNMSNADWILTKAWASYALTHFGRYPFLALIGVQGSGKSNTSWMLKNLIDPHSCPSQQLPNSARDLAVVVKDHHLPVFDNVSSIKRSLSDALCRLHSGVAFGTRKLFTNAQLFSIQVERPVILNGIVHAVTEGDLLERTITIEMDAIPEMKRLRHTEVERRFREMRGRLFGALVESISTGLRNHDSVKLERAPRLANFAHWAVAVGESLGYNEEAFFDALGEKRRESDHLAVLASPIGDSILRYLEAHESFEDTPTKLLDVLDLATSGNRARRGPGWPKRANVLSAQLKRIEPALRGLGIVVEHDRSGTKKNERMIRIRRAA